MTVYIEYAFAVNFLLDGLLVFLSLKCAHGRVGRIRLFLSAAVGAGEAIVFPMIPLPNWCAVLVKLLGGILLVLIAVGKGGRRTFLVAGVAFFALTFALGGLLTAVYSYFRIPYAQEGGYLVESAPVALVLAVAAIFAICTLRAAKGFYRYRNLKRNLFPCTVEAGGKKVEWRGLADSGNLLFFRGEPVNVISAAAALALFGKTPPLGRMQINTAGGSRDSPVFRAQSLTVGAGKRARRSEEPLFTVGEVDSGEYRIILHTSFLEAHREDPQPVENMAAKDNGR